MTFCIYWCKMIRSTAGKQKRKINIYRFSFFLLLLTNLEMAGQQTEIIRYNNGKIQTQITHHGADTIEQIRYYKNNRCKDSVWKTIEILVGKRETIDPKYPGDSIIMKVETPFGIEKKFYKNGKIKNSVYHGKNNEVTKKYIFRKKGSVSVYQEIPFGLKKIYNKKGKQIRQSDFNKNKYAKLPRFNRHHGHLAQGKFAGKVQNNKLVLMKDKKTLRISPSAFFSIQLSGDSVPMRHIVYEGKSEGKLLFSTYSYDLSASKNKLKYDSTFTISDSQLQTIFYACHNPRNKHFIASFMERAGFSMMLVPAIGVPLIAGAYYLIHPVTIGTIVAGIPVFIIGRQLYKKTVPKKYSLSEWKIKD